MDTADGVQEEGGKKGGGRGGGVDRSLCCSVEKVERIMKIET